jgi:hypothetical protein
MFKKYTEATESIKALILDTILGSEGAAYRHLDSEERIKELDNPLYLCFERKEKAIANITFCRRERDWYIRYFTFAKTFQTSSKKKRPKVNQSLLKKEINKEFETILSNPSDQGADLIYAYIDKKNRRSQAMAQQFGFQNTGVAVTQVFSRNSPVYQSTNFSKLNWKDVEEKVFQNYSEYQYFHTAQTQKGPFYGIRDKQDEIIAFARVHEANWEIIQLPGSLGSFLTKAIPYIPFLRKLITPKKHEFIAPDTVYVKDNDPETLAFLFESILAEKQKHLILWWVDEKDPLFIKAKKKIYWGVLHYLMGRNKVDIITKGNLANQINKSKLHYISGFDLI